MNDLLQVFLISTLPVGELRLSIPVGLVAFRLEAVSVFLVSVLGNFMSASIILFFLERVSAYLSKKFRLFKIIFTYWGDSARKKHSGKIEKYGIIGLVLFIAIPFPMTGAWTGALLATLFNIPLKKSLPAVLAGISIAGLIVTGFVLSGINIESFIGWQFLLGILIFTGLVYIYFKQRKK